jgi:hypothetical protein
MAKIITCSVARLLPRWGGTCLIAVLAITAGFATSASAAPSPPATAACPDAYVAALGPNVCVFSDTMSQSAIQSDLNNIATQQVPVASQFTSRRYAIFFQPGTYGSASSPLVFQVGYYTQVAGLGLTPQDTVIDGAIDVFNNFCTAGTQNCDSLENVWRSLSNLTLNVDLPASPPSYAPPESDPFGAGCTNSAEMWSVSQGAPIRRVNVNGSVVLQDYCANNNYTGGGYIADSEVSGELNFFGSEQYLVRNSDIGGANGCPSGLWNMVYSGVEGAPAPVFTGQCQQNTVLATSPVSEEEPFLYTGATGSYQVFVPAVQRGTAGPAWAGGSEPGRSIPLRRFFVATPSTPAVAMTAAVARGLNLILTPGVYDLNRAIVISRPGTVVLGLGLATLIPQRGNAAMIALPDTGVKLSGLIIDAGPIKSPVLLSIGTPRRSNLLSASNPDLVQDVFFRIGGAESTPVSATVSLLDNAPDSILDDVWAWRADHGNDVGWTSNTASTAVVVTGADVTSYGLAVDGYQKNEVIWSGQHGTDVLFRNELPEDPPSQQAWMASSTHDGYPAFLLTGNVKTFQGYGMGSYVLFINTSASLQNAEVFEAPNTAGVQFHNLFAVWEAGESGDASIINGTGGPVTSTNPGTVEPVDVSSYP